MNTIVQSGSLTLNNNAKLTITENVDINHSTFCFNGEGTVAAGDGATITISRDVYISGNITFEGNFEVSSQYGKIYFISGGSLTNKGTITLVNGGTVNGTISGNQPVTT